MTNRILTGTLALALSLSAGAAFAQSYNAPAGIPAAVAPGGLEGQAAPRNIAEQRATYDRAMRNDDLATGSVRTRRTAPNAYGR